MQLKVKIFTFLILVIAVNGQEFGRMQAPDKKMEEVPLTIDESIQKSFTLEKMVDPEQYILGPGDKIGLNILMGEALMYPLTVTPTGDLFIPGVGICHVAGISLADASGKVELFVRENAFLKAQTHMVLLRPREFKVFISGAVIKPGFAIITPLTRLDEVIEQVDGFQQLAKEYEIEIQREDGSREQVNYYDYLLEGKLSSNPTFREGDQIRVPFGSISKNGIVVRGSITGAGYDIIAPGETLENYIRRQVKFEKNADLQNITLTRVVNNEVTQIVVAPEYFGSTILQPQDEINFMWERGVMVIGFVQAPGGFSHYPGYSVSDYIALAGGNTVAGNAKAATVTHINGNTDKGLDTQIQRGDVIYIPRTKKDIIIGNASILGLTTAFMTVYLAYLSATK